MCGAKNSVGFKTTVFQPQHQQEMTAQLRKTYLLYKHPQQQISEQISERIGFFLSNPWTLKPADMEGLSPVSSPHHHKQDLIEQGAKLNYQYQYQDVDRNVMFGL